jgi:uncharacterized protein DUF4145
MANSPNDALPDPFDATCGWCGREVALLQVGRPHEVRVVASGPGGTRLHRMAATYLCPRKDCNRPTLAFFTVLSDRLEFRLDLIEGQLPAGSAASMEDLPDEIERDRLEAWSCFHAGNLRASAIMCRSAIQRAVRTLEAVGAGLKAEITNLVERGLIAKDLGDFAHEVRIVGDDTAHPSTLGEVTREQVRESLDFLDDFLRVAVALPERVRRKKAERRADSV